MCTSFGTKGALEGLATPYFLLMNEANIPRATTLQPLFDQKDQILKGILNRPPATIECRTDRISGASAVLVMDTLDYESTAGGMQIRSFKESNFSNHPLGDFGDLIEQCKWSARCGSWKCSLAGLPIGGGKILITAPDEILEDPTALKEMMGRFGKEFSKFPFWAKPDMRVNYELLEAYKAGGGKVSGSRVQKKLEYYTASSVIGGFESALKFLHGKELAGSKVILVGCAGRIGLQLLEMFHQEGAHLILVDRNPRVMELGIQYKAPVITLDEAIGVDADIFCSAARPGQFGRGRVNAVQARIIGGSANDLLKSSELYAHDRDVVFLPGAALTAASMYLPNGQRIVSDDDVRDASGKIINSVLHLHQESGGTMTTFEAMMLEAESMGQLVRGSYDAARSERELTASVSKGLIAMHSPLIAGNSHDEIAAHRRIDRQDVLQFGCVPFYEKKIEHLEGVQEDVERIKKQFKQDISDADLEALFLFRLKFGTSLLTIVDSVLDQHTPLDREGKTIALLALAGSGKSFATEILKAQNPEHALILDTDAMRLNVLLPMYRELEMGSGMNIDELKMFIYGPAVQSGFLLFMNYVAQGLSKKGYDVTVTGASIAESTRNIYFLEHPDCTFREFKAMKIPRDLSPHIVGDETCNLYHYPQFQHLVESMHNAAVERSSHPGFQWADSKQIVSIRDMKPVRDNRPPKATCARVANGYQTLIKRLAIKGINPIVIENPRCKNKGDIAIQMVANFKATGLLE